MVRDNHTDGRWILDAAPAPIVPGLTVTIEDGEMRGESPRNTFRSGWSQNDGPVGELSGTLIGCPPNVAEQEEAYFDLIGDTETVVVDDDRLTLSGPSGRLTYLRAD